MVFFLLSLTPPHKCACVTCESVCLREREGDRGVVSPPLVRCWCSPPSTLPSCLLCCCELNVLKRCCFLRLSHPFTRSCSTCPFPLPHSLSHSLCSLAAPPPPPSSSLLSSSSYITDYVHVSCCSLVTLCAVCNQRKGFPASVHKVEFTDGNAIHPSPQAPPSSPTIHPSFSRLCSMSSLNLFPPPSNVSSLMHCYSR